MVLEAIREAVGHDDINSSIYKHLCWSAKRHYDIQFP